MSAAPATDNPTGDDIQLVAFDPQYEREMQLKEAFGDAQLDQVLKFDEELLKAEWEAYNHKVKLLEPIYKRRGEFTKKIPGFWLKAMTNDRYCNRHVDAIDRDALAHLEDLTLEHDPSDARNHFSKGNPYFSDRTLSKKFAVNLPDKTEAVNGSGSKTNPLLIEMGKKYELDYPVKSTPVPIQWASDEHNLVAKKPGMTIEAIESKGGQVDPDEAYGSFFNFFSFEEDRYEIHSSLLELHSKALDLYAGVLETETDEDAYQMISEDEDDEEGDPNEVVDLESDSNDEPKKKKAKVAA